MMSWIASSSPQCQILPIAGHCHGPVDDKRVHVGCPQVCQGGLQVRTDMLGAVVGAPELGLAGDTVYSFFFLVNIKVTDNFRGKILS